MATIIRGKNPARPYTVRYRADGKQREKSFRTQAEARDFRTAVEYDIRSGTFVDPTASKGNFGTACETWISRLACAPRSREAYRSTYRKHVKPALGSRTLGSVAADRDAVSELLTVTMADLSVSPRRQARMIVTGTLDEAVRAGVLPRHRCAGIPLADSLSKVNLQEFDAALFPTFAQLQAIADSAGLAVWLMRACGLRISEALAVEKGDFTMAGRLLRVSRQATRDGKAAVPCKKRRSTREFRTVPVPAYLWAMVRGLPDGPLMPGNGRLYQTYAAVAGRFMSAAKRAGVDESVTPHWLRHQFASVLLGAGVPLTDVSEWLGHRDAGTTVAVYRSIMPDAPMRAAGVLDAEYLASVAG